MKKSVSRSFLKVLSVTAAAAAILTLTGCVEEPASTSPASSPASSVASSSTSTSTSTAPSSSASSKTEQEATSTSQNPELPASSSSEASSPASSTPASSEVKTNKGDTPANPAKLNESVEIDGIEFGYASALEIDENSSILMVGIMVANHSTQTKLAWEKTAEELYAILPSDSEMQDATQTSAALNAIFAPSSTGFTARIGSTTLPTACYVDNENGTASIAPGEEGMVCLCIQEPTTWNTIQLQISVNNTNRYFEIAKEDVIR